MPDRLMETSTDAVRLRMPRLAYGVLHSINAQTAFMIMAFYARRMALFAARPADRDCKNLMRHVTYSRKVHGMPLHRRRWEGMPPAGT